ncbi:hypothetical protein [Streptomyces scabiei]|uniref:hypothetical protein n=1 Tax=Streptomyces scabiei TaxID=1930 RepID=UPI0038F5DE96
MTNPETEPVCKFEQGCHRVVPCDPGCGTPVVPPPMSRAAKAEALLLRFTAEAHRRKWNYDRGLDGDGVPVKSEAFDALHRLGEEMRVALEELRRVPAAVSVPPPAPRADDRAAVCICGHTEAQHFEDACITEVTGCDCGDFLTGEAAREVIARWRDAAIQARADRAAILTEAADEAETVAESLRKHHEFERSTGALDVMTELRRLAAAPGPCVAGEQQNETSEALRCGHTDIVYGRCVRFIDDHEGECVHEHQPAAGAPE